MISGSASVFGRGRLFAVVLLALMGSSAIELLARVGSLAVELLAKVGSFQLGLLGKAGVPFSEEVSACSSFILSLEAIKPNIMLAWVHH